MMKIEDNYIDFNISKLRNLLKLVKPRKASKPVCFHGLVLKNCAFGLAYSLSKLYQVSQNSDIIPQEWKLANFAPSA